MRQSSLLSSSQRQKLRVRK